MEPPALLTVAAGEESTGRKKRGEGKVEERRDKRKEWGKEEREREVEGTGGEVGGEGEKDAGWGTA